MLQEHKRISGLTGNEIFFLERMGYRPGQLCVGNSVVALGVVKGTGAGLSTFGSNHPASAARADLAARFTGYPVEPIMDAQEWVVLKTICE